MPASEGTYSSDTLNSANFLLINRLVGLLQDRGTLTREEVRNLYQSTADFVAEQKAEGQAQPAGLEELLRALTPDP